MLKNYFKIAWRSLVHNRVFSIINILGLAIGMGVVLLISLWIWDELSYNKDFAHYDRIVRVMVNQTHGNNTQTQFSVPIPLSGELRTRYASDFKKVSVTSWNATHILAVGDKQLSKNGLYIQPDMLDILSLRMIGGAKAVLDDPSSILLSQTMARALFGEENPVNKTLKFDNRKDFKVAGVFADLPFNSDFRETNFFAPWADYEASEPWVKSSATTWNNNAFQIFTLLQDQTDLEKLKVKVKGALNGHGRNDKPEVVLHPMNRWHLYSSFKDGKNAGGAIVFVWMFGIIGAFVLLLACINFMNLSTARSEKRAKEVGIRKAIGSLRGQLIGQFLGESIFIALLSFALSLLLVEMALPWFNGVADKQMHIFWDSPLFWGLSIGFTLLVGLIAGSYPAFYLSSFNSVKVLKGTFKAGRWAAIPRKALIVLQFTVSVFLIVGTIIVFQQIIYVKNRPVGYTRDGLLTIDITTKDLTRHYNSIREELLHSGAVVNVTESSSPTTAVWSNQSGFTWEGKDPNLVPSFAVIHVTHDFGSTVGWQFVAGRDFSRSFSSDSTAMILNETAVKYMGLKNPVGATVKYLYSDRADQHYRVIGVIKDMVMESPFAPAKQSVFMIDDNDNANVIMLKMNPNLATSRALAMIGPIFKKYNPGAPFDYSFTDEVYAQKFQMEERVGHIASFFTIFAIFISCLGLFGLASFMAEQRIKEIGVRKVLGASVLHLWGLLSRELLGLVGLSFFIALPAAWYVMHGWLRHYEYRVTISVWVFVGTAVLAMLITLATVSFQSVRAAMANPIRSLRTE